MGWCVCAFPYLCKLAQRGVGMGHGLVCGQAEALDGVGGLGGAVSWGHTGGGGGRQGPGVVHRLLGASWTRLEDTGMDTIINIIQLVMDRIINFQFP